MLVRLRYSEVNPGEITGYAVAHPGYTERDGSRRWYGGGRLASGLTLPQLRRIWERDRTDTDLRAGSFRLTGPERDAVLQPRRPASQRGCGADPAQRQDRPDRGRRCGLGGGRDLPRDSPGDREPGAAGCDRRLRPRVSDGLWEDSAADRRGRRPAHSCPAPGHGGRPRRRQHAGSDPADRQPGPVGQSCGRAAPGRSSTPRRLQRRGRLQSASTRASVGRGQGSRRQADHSSHSSPALPGGHETSPVWTSRLRRGPASLQPKAATASPSRDHSRARDPYAARPAAPDRAADSTPAPGSGGPKSGPLSAALVQYMPPDRGMSC